MIVSLLKYFFPSAQFFSYYIRMLVSRYFKQSLSFGVLTLIITGMGAKTAKVMQLST
jgi:hypothetical protein